MPSILALRDTASRSWSAGRVSFDVRGSGGPLETLPPSRSLSSPSSSSAMVAVDTGASLIIPSAVGEVAGGGFNGRLTCVCIEADCDSS